ncbi:nuclear transport factor 2 family protein [Actinomycetospora sp. OC33-EN08]|uniref:Nuclear transport factor 2 family protein n=1 Tax=Actinomycetospora aurantiaca TaxID=3129233 RepID=A0ABU8MXF9_9PSEU
MTQHTDLPSEALPTTVRDFMAAHAAGEHDTASTFFTEDVVLVDVGDTIRGREQVHAFLREAGARFRTTTEQIGARRVDAAHAVVTVRLTGDFPGGVVELDYRFTLRDGLVAELVIAGHDV